MSDTKSYPGIPAGVLDEDLEEYMSEKKGPFGAALMYLPDIDECRPAIRLLEVAGKVDKKRAIMALPVILDSGVYNRLRALLEALPDKEEK